MGQWRWNFDEAASALLRFETVDYTDRCKVHVPRHLQGLYNRWKSKNSSQWQSQLLGSQWASPLKTQIVRVKRQQYFTTYWSVYFNNEFLSGQNTASCCRGSNRDVLSEGWGCDGSSQGDTSQELHIWREDLNTTRRCRVSRWEVKTSNLTSNLLYSSFGIISMSRDDFKIVSTACGNRGWLAAKW